MAQIVQKARSVREAATTAKRSAVTSAVKMSDPKRPTMTTTEATKPPKSQDPNPRTPKQPNATLGKKRSGSSKFAPSKPAKRPKPDSPIETPTSQKLDVYVFGAGEVGELGLGHIKTSGLKIKDIRYPRLNKLLDAKTVGVVQIAVGGMHCIALTHDQKILTWGVNDNWALGRDTTWEAPTRDADAGSGDEEDESGLNPKESTPTAIPAELFSNDIKGFVQVAATDSASFVVTVDGFVYGWGTFSANDGIFGFFKEDSLKEQKIQKGPALIPELKNIKSLAAGSNHVLALDYRGNVFAWGCGEQGQLGRHSVERRRFNSLIPSPVGLPKNKVKYISCGSYHNFAIDVKGRVWTWGLNNFGQTGVQNGAGDGDAYIERRAVVQSLESFEIKEIQGGNHHSIACTEDGKLLVWGRCDDAQIGILVEDLPQGNLIFDSRNKPRILMKPAIILGIHAVFVAAGIDNSIAITKDGEAYSWGFSANYRTGLGTEGSVKEATLMQSAAVRDKILTFAGCGGQFGVLAGPAAAK